MNYLKHGQVHSQRLERWLGADKIAKLQADMRGWYAGPISIADVPGDVLITPEGDFVGSLKLARHGCGLEAVNEAMHYRRKAALRKHMLRHGIRSKQAGMAGFTSLSDLVSEATVAGKMQPLNGNLVKAGTTGVVGVTNSLWRVGSSPAAGAAATAGSAGVVPTSLSTGAMSFTNPSVGGDLQYLVSGDMSASVVGNSLLVYDRIFAAQCLVNTTANQNITGVPTRYQNTTSGNPDSANGNFVFFEVGTVLAATAHNLTLSYRDQNGNAAVAAPSLAGVSGAIANRLDHAGWFVPLAAGDSGVLDISFFALSATLASGAMDTVMGHPVAWMAFPVANLITPFDWVNVKFAPGRVFDNACLALLEVGKPSTTATTYTGQLLAAWG
jgi:hypothetical protein